MGRHESNAGNDTFASYPLKREVWVGMEATPSGHHWHVATDPTEAPTVTVFNILATRAADTSIPLADFWAELSIKLPDWSDRVAATGAARGLTIAAYRGAARRAFL